MTWQDSAQLLGQHPTELALGLSLLISLTLTAGIMTTERARPWLRAGFERRPKFLGERSAVVFRHLDEALVLLALALVGVFGGCSVFLHLVEGLLESTWLPQWDTAFVQSAHRTATRAEIAFFSFITPLAGVYPPIVLGVLVTILLVRRQQHSLCLVWVAGLIGNSLLIQTLKTAFQRQRPTFDEPFLVESNFSFPSGHATTSILLYGLLAYVSSRVFFRYQPGHRHFMIWVLTFMGVLIGTSRLVLGVHYPSDVLAGWSVGTAWLALLVLVAETLRGRFGPVDRLWARWRGRSPKVESASPSR